MKRAATPLFSKQALRDAYRSFSYKGRERITLMSIDRFLSLAAQLNGPPTEYKISRVEKAIREKLALADIPYLVLNWRYPDKRDDTVLMVTGHEGRHRALVLKSLGYTHMPVLLCVPFRWSEQNDHRKFDYEKRWPTHIVPENRPRAEKIPFPIQRERATGGAAVWVNPRAYHGTHQEVAVFASAPKRDLRNYESIGTFVTTDKEHAKMFGKFIHQVDLPETLKLYADHDRDDLRTPFLTPALSASCKVLNVAEKRLLQAAFVACPVDNAYFGTTCYEQVSSEFRSLMRDLDKDDLRRYKFLHRHPNVPKYVSKCESSLETARDIERDKLFHNKEYALFLWEFYTSRGYDGIAWENTCMDAGFHDSNDRRQSQYLIFHPDRYSFTRTAD